MDQILSPTKSKQRFQAKWYAIYTLPNHEKKIYELLTQKKIHAFLPLQTTIRKWSDRRKKIYVPLFSCYVFVKITAKEYFLVLNTPGVIRYVTFEGKAASIPESQIRLIKNILEFNLEIEEVSGTIEKGEKVEVKFGILRGLMGELIEFANNKRVILKIEEIDRTLLVNIPLNYLKQVS